MDFLKSFAEARNRMLSVDWSDPVEREARQARFKTEIRELSDALGPHNLTGVTTEGQRDFQRGYERRTWGYDND